MWRLSSVVRWALLDRVQDVLCLEPALSPAPVKPIANCVMSMGRPLGAGTGCLRGSTAFSAGCARGLGAIGYLGAVGILRPCWGLREGFSSGRLEHCSRFLLKVVDKLQCAFHIRGGAGGRRRHSGLDGGFPLCNGAGGPLGFEETIY